MSACGSFLCSCLLSKVSISLFAHLGGGLLLLAGERRPFHLSSFGRLEHLDGGAARGHPGPSRFLCAGPVSLHHPRAMDPRPAELLQPQRLVGPIPGRPCGRSLRGTQSLTDLAAPNLPTTSHGSRNLPFQGKIIGDVRSYNCTTVFFGLVEKKFYLFYFRLDCTKYTFTKAAQISLQRGTKAAT